MCSPCACKYIHLPCSLYSKALTNILQRANDGIIVAHHNGKAGRRCKGMVENRGCTLANIVGHWLYGLPPAVALPAPHKDYDAVPRQQPLSFYLKPSHVSGIIAAIELLVGFSRGIDAAPNAWPARVHYSSVCMRVTGKVVSAPAQKTSTIAKVIF